MEQPRAPSRQKTPLGAPDALACETMTTAQPNPGVGGGQQSRLAMAGTSNRALNAHTSAAASAAVMAGGQNMISPLNLLNTLIAPNPSNSMASLGHASHQATLPAGMTPQVLAMLGAGLLPVSALTGAVGSLIQAASHSTTHSLQGGTGNVSGTATTSSSSGTIANSLLSNMQRWKLAQLEAHVKLLHETNQPVPQPVALLLSEARRKEDKRAAKRVANRKSAFTSRARKKALVEEMTKANARLRRQALILSLLPDLVITVSVDGEITFCSGQVERVLCHSVDDLIGAHLSEILTPPSRDSLSRLIKELVNAEKQACKEALKDSSTPQIRARANARPSNDMSGKHKGDSIASSLRSSAAVAADLSSGGAIVTEKSFPLSVVKLDSQENVGDNSDLSASKPTSDRQEKSDISSSSPKPRPQSSSDDSFSSSSDVKNMRKASEALNRNVRWHNEKMGSTCVKAQVSHKDDVTGAYVTANNADARLSSLQHRSESPIDGKTVKRPRFEVIGDQNSSSSSSDSLLEGAEKKKERKDANVETSSEDSGYRESNESSREDTFSDSASASQNVDRPKPLAPTCTLCLIRSDLTTIWCEVTSSIRTRDLNEEVVDEEPAGFAGISDATKDIQSFKSSPSSSEEAKELLLCLRPIRDGEERVGEDFRFIPKREIAQDPSIQEEAGSAAVVSSITSSGQGHVDSSGSGDAQVLHGPPKKRPLPNRPVPVKKRKVAKQRDADATERSAVESLMLMQSPKKSQHQ